MNYVCHGRCAADGRIAPPWKSMTDGDSHLLQVRRLPVVDDDGHLVGIFTRGDVIKAALEARRAAANSN